MICIIMAYGISSSAPACAAASSRCGMMNGRVSELARGCPTGRKRIPQLRRQARRDWVAGNADRERLAVGRHVKGAEEEIEDGEQTREIRILAFGLTAVMPAVEQWTGDDIA
jgi:hypothetical protein